MTKPTDLQLVQAARDILERTHPTNPVLVSARLFAMVELDQAEHDAKQGREIRPRVAILAQRITKEEL
ncbi:hypothetical protein [Pseudoclavibacter sp. JSM 162008]|uniref:hypothetical protein n=1 Tax=Pseudoclavibacter sp. JSM 162008 TaxID=3229855 RepID=UPI0035245F1F